MFHKPAWLFSIAAAAAIVFFLMGAPSLSEGTGVLQDVVAWVQTLVGLVAIVVFALGVRALIARRRKATG
jgi:hypothetical protein